MKNVDVISLLEYNIGASMIKFQTLDELFDTIPKIEQDHIVFHVDLNAVLCRCYIHSSYIMEAYNRIDFDIMVMKLVISIINVIAHYRKYFTFKLRKKNTIIITYDTELSGFQKSLCPELREEHFKKYTTDHPMFGRLNQAIRKAYEYVQVLCSYFEDIYCIDYDTGVDSITTMAVIRNEPKYRGSFHILFTRNMIATQMCNTNTVMLYNKKDNSRLLTEKNAISDGLLMDSKRTRPDTKELAKERLNPNMVPYLIMLTSTKNILKCVKGLKLTLDDGIHLIVTMFDRKMIDNQVSVMSFIDALEQLRLEKKHPPKKRGKRGRKSKKNSKKKHLTVGPRYLKELEFYEHSIDRVVELEKIEETYDFVIDEKTYVALLNRYRVVCVRNTMSAVTKQQLLKIRSRMFNLYNQEYLEQMNEILSQLGPDANLVEISVLNQNDPTVYSHTDIDSMRW